MLMLVCLKVVETASITESQQLMAEGRFTAAGPRFYSKSTVSSSLRSVLFLTAFFFREEVEAQKG